TFGVKAILYFLKIFSTLSSEKRELNKSSIKKGKII
ncbi:hypothetical protein LCGC14_3132380, partial [marine sediment metagenome]